MPPAALRQRQCVNPRSVAKQPQLRAPGRLAQNQRRAPRNAAAYSPQLEHSLAFWQQLLEAPAAPCAEASAARWVSAATTAAAEAPVQAASSAGGLIGGRVLRNRRGLWRIRHYQPADLLPVADLQASSFHEALPLGLLDGLAFTVFKAEVLDALKKKQPLLRDDGFAMLVVEECSGLSSSSSSDGSSSDSDCASDCDWEEEPQQAPWQHGGQQAAAGPAAAAAAAAGGCGSSGGGGRVVGVVEVGVQDEPEVLGHLGPGCSSYAYVSSMAVSPRARRCGVGAALLAAAEAQAASWGQAQVCLHVFDTNTPALRLYARCGMARQATDPAWKALLGGRVRHLMVKQLL